ncbi:MAG: ATP-binding protein [Cystobacterineae bacterium]|nr:ATP-binding protein [Cystobacterineae bacterium]
MSQLIEEFEDVAQRELILQRDRLATLGTLSAGLAHEINNPLAYLLANLRFLSREIFDLKTQLETGRKSLADAEPLFEEWTKLLSESVEGLQQIGRLAKDMQGFARSNSNQEERFEMQEVIESALRIVWHELKNRVLLKKNFERLLPRLWGNPSQIQQVFINLLINAVQAINLPTGVLGKIEIVLSRKENGVLAVIQDNGPGIPAEHMDKLFDPFFTTKAFGKGTGLGLYICKQLVVRHGGYLRLESNSGQGTQAHVWLPAHTAVN